MNGRRIPGLVAAFALATAALAMVAFRASIFGELRHRFRRHSGRDAIVDRVSERDRVRAALAPITVKLDPAKYKRGLKALPEDFDLEGFRQSMPIFDPPLSQAIVDERESNGH